MAFKPKTISLKVHQPNLEARGIVNKPNPPRPSMFFAEHLLVSSITSWYQKWTPKSIVVPGSFGRIRSNVPNDMAVVEDLRLVGGTLSSLKVIGSTLNCSSLEFKGKILV